MPAVFAPLVLNTQKHSIDTATGKEAPAALSTERVHDIFSAIARRYELFNMLSSFGTYKGWLAKMTSMANVLPSEEVLDIAGGTGDVTFAIARRFNPKHIQCTDLVPEMLDVARTHYANGAAGKTPVTFEVVDAQNIPYENESYDVVTMAYGLRNMPERQRALAEIFRVLQPGGRLVCLDFSTPQNSALRALYGIYLKYAIPFWGRIVTGDSSGFVYLANSIKAFPDQQGIAEMMTNAGFNSVHWQNCSGGISCIHIAVKPT